MKTLFFLIATCIFSINTIATNNNVPNNDGDKYCTKMEDGKLTLTHQGNKVTSDVTLNNGATIKTDGTLIKKDGSKVMLKDGECINKAGKVVEHKKKENNKKGMY